MTGAGVARGPWCHRGIGSALAVELADRGLLVRGVSRSGASPAPGVEGYGADLRDPAEVTTAIAGAEVVYHCAQPAYTRWPEEFLALNDHITTAVQIQGARLVVADNLYAYGPRPGGWGPGTQAGALREDARPEAAGRKGALRARLVDDLLAAHRQGRIRVSIGRLADYYGPRGISSLFGTSLFGSVLRDRPVRWFGRTDQPHSVAYLPDAARALALLGSDPQTDGRIWHLPHTPAVTPAEFVNLVQDTAGVVRRMRTLPVGVVRVAGLIVPMARELGELAYQVQEPFVVDHSAFEAHFGRIEPTPSEIAIAHTLAWFAKYAPHQEGKTPIPAARPF